MKTKTCIQCNKEFEVFPIIEDKKRDLRRRKYCLECKPLNYRLYQKELEKQHLRKCCVCKSILDLNNFYTEGNKYQYRCKKCNHLQASKRKNTLRKKIKLNLKCSICGYKKCPDAIEFHHTDPNFKEKNISKMYGSAANKKLQQELEKCLVVCANCHREIHWKLKNEN